MALLETKGYTLEGVAACVPKNSFSVNSYPFASNAERNDFINKVGVHEKRVAQPGVTSSDLCINAAEDLIKTLKWDKSQIELLVFVTQTPDYLIPFGSATIQHKLGLSNNCASFDFHTGCSGWVYGLSFIYGFMQTYKLKKALLLCGETAHIVSKFDKTTFPLMGDAGTATAISETNFSGSSFFNLQTFGRDSDAITIPDGGAKELISQQSLVLETHGEGVQRTRLNASMNGSKIIEFSLLLVPKNIKELLEFASLSVEDIDFLLLHQANKILCEGIRKRLKVEAKKTPYSIHEFGNTSSASIPLTLVSQMRETLLLKPVSIIVCGFGVGLSIASAILPLQKMNCVSLSEL